MPGQVVDAEAAADFIRETLEKVTHEVLANIAADLGAKSRLYAERLEPSRLALGDRADLRTILRNSFSTRRKADAILDELGVVELASALDDLLRGEEQLPQRYERFQTFLAPFPGAAFELPSEILHFTHPDRYWLWSRWMWDPRTETGALALVTADDFDFDDDPAGTTYLRVGQAVAFVSETGQSAGFSDFDDSPFSVDVFLACVYAVYMYTVLRLRMTQEFNRIVPQQDELVRRLLGVHKWRFKVPIGGKKEEPIAHEFDTVTVNSTISGRPWELSGHWNRMFEQRVIFDYDTDGFEAISLLDGGESLEWCYRCGQCLPVCPVDIVGNYGPMRIHQLVQMGTDLATHDDLWLCTTCMNCLRVCPKEVDMIKIMPAVRETAVNVGNVPSELQDVFEKTFRYGNALGSNPKRRHAWTKGLDVRVLADDPSPVDVLFYVEDYWSYHPRGQDAAKAFVRIIEHLDVDWAILGAEEKTVGDSQRLAGEKGLFESLVEDVSSTLSKYEFSRIVTPDPHGYNALLNVYPNYGHNYDVLHYTQLLSPMIDNITWERDLDYTVTFHDPCYLGRHNGEYDAPRKLIEAIPGITLVEMARCRENGYCCGGGGGGMWLDGLTDNHTSERLSERRVREAVESGADVLAVCCPYEVSRFEDTAKSTGNPQLKVLDIVELMDEAMTVDAS